MYGDTQELHKSKNIDNIRIEQYVHSASRADQVLSKWGHMPQLKIKK